MMQSNMIPSLSDLTFNMKDTYFKGIRETLKKRLLARMGCCFLYTLQSWRSKKNEDM